MEENRIKLVQVIGDSAVGGGPNHILGILRNIDKKKFDCYLICPPGYLSAEAKLIEDVTVYNVPMRSKFDLLSILKLNRIIQEIQAKDNPFGPLIIHSHGSRAGLMARLRTPKNTKTVYTEHRYDHDFHINNSINEFLQKWVMKIQNKRSDLIIAVSSSVKKFLLDTRLVLENKVITIPNGIDLNSFGKNLTGKDVKHPIIGTVGNLNIHKGHEYLIKAMAKLKKNYPLVTLEIIGEGGDRSRLQELIKSLKLEHNVALLGRKQNINKHMKHWSVFVLPSIAETFGIAILEAMASGVPVVASRVGGIPDIITNRKNGILVPSKDTERLAKEIEEIINHPALAAKLRREGIERVKEFEWKKVIKLLEEAYVKLLLVQ